MKKLLALAAFASALLAPGAAQAQDSVVGEGRVLLTDFTISVHAGPNGENPTGLLAMTGFVTGNAVPTCLYVSGNRAVGGFTLVDGPVSGRGFITEVEDNGPPINGQPADVTNYAGFYAGFIIPGSGPTMCPAPGTGPPPGFSSVGAGPFLSGDITITDAPPLPISKDQCTNGGWKTFGVFKSQGDCQLRSDGREEPAGQHRRLAGCATAVLDSTPPEV